MRGDVDSGQVDVRVSGNPPPVALALHAPVNQRSALGTEFSQRAGRCGHSITSFRPRGVLVEK